ncbi:MAG: sugar ABC transporter ATP-binding protein, partial [Acinetobacter sp.]
ALTNDQRTILFKIVRELVRENQTTVLYVSHRLEEVMALGDRTTIFRDGRFIATRKISELCIDDIVTTMVGREIDKTGWGKSYATTDVLMRVEHLTKHRQFENISFELHKGEILGFAGFVGAGRTELLTSIFGANPPDSGEVYIKQKRARIQKPADAIAYGISMIPENRRDDALIAEMSIKQNAQLVILPKLISHGFISKKKAEKAMTQMIEDYSIKVGHVNHSIMTLSGGNQQKVVIARWIANNPNILLCDEPTRGIDVGAKAEVYEILRDIAAKGIGVVMVSSELPELLTLCDRIIVMHEGKITGELNREEASEERIMQYAAKVV